MNKRSMIVATMIMFSSIANGWVAVDSTGRAVSYDDNNGDRKGSVSDVETGFSVKDVTVLDKDTSAFMRSFLEKSEGKKLTCSVPPITELFYSCSEGHGGSCLKNTANFKDALGEDGKDVRFVVGTTVGPAGSPHYDNVYDNVPPAESGNAFSYAYIDVNSKTIPKADNLFSVSLEGSKILINYSNQSVEFGKLSDMVGKTIKTTGRDVYRDIINQLSISWFIQNGNADYPETVNKITKMNNPRAYARLEDRSVQTYRSSTTRYDFNTGITHITRHFQTPSNGVKGSFDTNYFVIKDVRPRMQGGSYTGELDFLIESGLFVKNGSSLPTSLSSHVSGYEVPVKTKLTNQSNCERKLLLFETCDYNIAVSTAQPTTIPLGDFKAREPVLASCRFDS